MTTVSINTDVQATTRKQEHVDGARFSALLLSSRNLIRVYDPVAGRHGLLDRDRNVTYLIEESNWDSFLLDRGDNEAKAKMTITPH